MTRWPREALFPTDVPFDVQRYTALLVRVGSRGHGLWIPPEDDAGIDDEDLYGVVVPPVRFYLGAFSTWGGANEIRGSWDVVLCELRKFVRLAVAQNPNVLAVLWADPGDVLHTTAVGEWLLSLRDELRDFEKAYAAFCGYARAQIQKMAADGQAYKGYMGAKRRAIVDRFGYDTKNAAHAVRLLHMGEEYLREGVLHVRRTHDKDLLLDIKRGKYTIAWIRDYVEKSLVAMEEAHARYTLVKRPLDPVDLDNRLVAVLQASFAESR